MPLINIPAEICEGMQAKQHKSKSSKYVGFRNKHYLEVVYSDVCEPLQVYSIGGTRYFVTLIDDQSRKLWTYCLHEKLVNNR